MSPTVIRFVFPRMNLGGAEKHAVLLASGLRKRGWDAGIVTIFEEGILAGAILKEGIPLTSLGCKGWGLGTLVRIFQWLRLSRIDILHTYLFGFHFFLGFPAKFAPSPPPILVSSRREIAHWQKKRHVLMEKLGNLFTDRVVCCSRAVERRTVEREGLPSGKVVTIYNGIDLERFQLSFSSHPLTPTLSPSGGEGRARGEIRKEFNIPESSPVIGTVANFSYEKGYPYLLEAAALILEASPQARLLFVGSGPLENEIRAKIQSLPGRERIILAGARSDIPELMEAMDIFVLSSVIEGFPNVLLEASAMARPLVATQVGGIPELIQSGENGILVPSRDGKALAGAILSLLNDPEKAGQMAHSAQKKIRDHFNLKRMVDDYENLYLSLIEEKYSKRHPHPEESILPADTGKKGDKGSRSFAAPRLSRSPAPDEGLDS